MKFLSASAFLLVLSALSFAQTVKITPQAKTYNRPKKENFENKEKFVVTRPKVSGLSPALNKKVENSLSFERNYENFDLREEINEIYWLEDAGYAVDYNKNGVLVVTLSLEGSGAYPSVYNKTVVVNLKTGERVRPADVFINLAGLAALARRAQQAEMRRARADYKRDPEARDFNGDEYFRNAKFSVEQLKEFSVSDKGVTFIYDYGFPHVALALQPDGRFFFNWAQMKPFIKRGGLLAGFVR